MAKFHIMLFLVILASSLVVNQATVRLSEWSGSSPKGYNGQKAIRLPEWPGIPPKGYNGQKIIKLPEWPGIPPKGYNGQKIIKLPEWPGIPPKGYNGHLTTAEIAPSAVDEVADAPYSDEVWPGIPPKGYNGQKIIKLPEWPGIPPKGYNGQKIIKLPEWPDIPPKGYNGHLTTAEIAPSAVDEVADAPYSDEVWLEASALESVVPSQ